MTTNLIRKEFVANSNQVFLITINPKKLNFLKIWIFLTL